MIKKETMKTDHLSLISDEDEIKVLYEKFKENGFHCSPYEDPNRIWDTYKLLEEKDLPELQKCVFVSRFNVGKRCHLFLIKINGENHVYFLDSVWYRCQELESYFESSLYYGTLFDGELVETETGYIFIVFDVLALGGIITDKMDCFEKSEPPYAVSIDATKFGLDYRIEFANLLFGRNEFFFRNELVNPLFEFRVQTYHHISEFNNLVSREIPNDTEFVSDSVIFQGNDFMSTKYIYHVQRVSLPPSSTTRAGTKIFTVFKDKYPGIWTIYSEKRTKEHLYVPSLECYQKLHTIANNTPIPCIYNKTQGMWMPAFF